MKIIDNIAQIRSILNEKRPTHSIGLVPTMGALHEGHLSLVESAKKNNDIVIVSIFVNPTQFNSTEDLDKYPRTVKDDAEILEKNGVDYLFIPKVSEIYPDKHILKFSAGYLDHLMEGATRPGHFSGVIQIVSKLFNIIQPKNAYFGQKDLQQLTLIKRLATELCFDINIVGCPIIRETNGLAMSSRNKRLSKEEKEISSNLFVTLQLIAEELKKGTPQAIALEKATAHISKFDNTKLEYIDIADATYLTPVDSSSTTIAICIACYVGEVRLIDNIILEK